MKTFSLLRAAMSQDMSLFKFKTGPNASLASRIILPVFLFCVVSMSIGTLAVSVAEVLHPADLDNLMLCLFMAFVTLLAFSEGIYKSQGVLFECKDNDLLFSLPIKRSTILLLRVFKLITFEIMFNAMFLLPCFAVYAYYVHPGVNFYLLAALMMILIPIVPTVVSSLLGYFVKLISSKSNKKKVVQAILTTVVFILVFLFSYKSKALMNYILKNATSINDLITRIYYPIGAFISLLDKFDIVTFILLLVFNIVPLILFVVILQKSFYKTISRLKGVDERKVKSGKIDYKETKPIMALTLKEMKRYLSSSVLMFNTMFGLLMSIIFTLVLCIGGKGTLVKMLAEYGLSDKISIEFLFYFILFFSFVMTTITSSSISLEGKTINITKTLPVDFKTILKSKILNCIMLEVPFAIISIIIFMIFYKTSLVFILLVLASSIFTIIFCAVTGLIFNLKYPKLDALNDTEVVKQSMSTFASVMTNMFVFMGSIMFIIFFSDKLGTLLSLSIHVGVLVLITLISYIYLMIKGPIKYMKLNV